MRDIGSRLDEDDEEYLLTLRKPQRSRPLFILESIFMTSCKLLSFFLFFFLFLPMFCLRQNREMILNKKGEMTMAMARTRIEKKSKDLQGIEQSIHRFRPSREYLSNIRAKIACDDAKKRKREPRWV